MSWKKFQNSYMVLITLFNTQNVMETKLTELD